MKKFAYLLMAITMLASSSQAFGQTNGGGNGNVQLPAVQMARDAFFASLNAYQLAQSEAYYWQSSQGRWHPNAGSAAIYWQISANYQYQAVSKLYSVWTGLEERGYIMPIDRQLALEAETHSLDAGWYAMVGASLTTNNIWEHPAVMAAEEAFDKIELLVEELD